MAQKEILHLDRGTDFDQTITIYDRNGAVVDLTGSVGAMQIRKTPLQPDPPLLAVGNDAFTFNAQGEMRIQIPRANTSVAWRRGYFDIEVTKAGKVIREIQGVILVEWDVTR